MARGKGSGVFFGNYPSGKSLQIGRKRLPTLSVGLSAVSNRTVSTTKVLTTSATSNATFPIALSLHLCPVVSIAFDRLIVCKPSHITELRNSISATAITDLPAEFDGHTDGSRRKCQGATLAPFINSTHTNLNQIRECDYSYQPDISELKQ